MNFVHWLLPQNEIAFPNLENTGCLQRSQPLQSPATDENQKVFHFVNNCHADAVPFHEQSIPTRRLCGRCEKDKVFPRQQFFLKKAFQMT
jgi:hypothetical protein